MREGFSYIFEAVYRDNQIVLVYPFDGLVLLAVFDESGCEVLDPLEKVSVAEAMEVPLVPRVYGTLNTLQKTKFLKAKEGWVTGNIDKDGALVREKVISPEWTNQKLAIQLFNPTTVWRSCAEALDLDSIASTISPTIHNYMSPSMLAHTSLPAPPLLAPCIRCGCSSELDDEGERICFCNTCKDTGCSSVVPCSKCGCSRERDNEGERVCFCDTCKITGCGPDNGQTEHHCLPDYNDVRCALPCLVFCSIRYSTVLEEFLLIVHAPGHVVVLDWTS